MKRYFAFYGCQYYPSGGMDDFIGDFDIINDAILAIKEANKQSNYFWHEEIISDMNYAEIWDSTERTNIDFEL